LNLVYRIFDNANSRKIHIQTYRDEKVLVEPENIDRELDYYTKSILMSFEVIDDIHLLREPPVKIMAIDLDQSGSLDDFYHWLDANEAESCNYFYSNAFYLEIVPNGLSKGNAIRQLCSLLNIPIENTIAAGDAVNDLSMIDAAGIGVAMQNAAEDIKAHADYVTKNDNNHDGVCEIINLFLLSDQH
jgi:Cof subfamily protein (haloacid dehalogenase superfamily)